MDTSEIYIKMSHLAFPEPETLPEPPCHKLQNHIYVDTKGQWWADWQAWFIPLYRQDQLQEMIRNEDLFSYAEGDKDKPLLDNLLEAFRHFYTNQAWYSKAIVSRPSMEQLWLAFVVKEKYNKIWDGEDWVEG